MPVATLAEGMMQDAWNYFSSEKRSASDKNVAIFANNDIYRLSQVCLSHCLLYFVSCSYRDFS